ncbi:hypothetical protein [Sedimentibacter sp.]|nr:hypothetical protein [Sedimentibacter sp.]
MDINSIIKDLGFPIACVIGCGWFIYKMYFNSIKKMQQEKNAII